ncbi:MAG: hypothetical protein ACNS61_14245 [Candidatus Wenzhouxiangella sp. M2_3B_020]
MKTFAIALAALLAPLLASGQDAAHPHWLAERAATSDIVALAQLDRIDYEYKRGYPVSGRAWLRPLITYKSAEPLTGILVVGEQGLKDNECYFPRVDPWDERPRYLLFLVEDEDKDTLGGHPDGCAIEILVDSGGGYAARWPQPAFGGENGRGGPAIRDLVERMTFQGPMARIDASDMLDHRRRDRAERDFMDIDGKSLVPTRGIELTELRRLMQPGLETEEADAAERKRLSELRERMLQDSSSDDDG